MRYTIYARWQRQSATAFPLAGRFQSGFDMRALLPKPRVILADEPVSMVDASLRATILESLRALNRDFGISILYVTHDLTTAYQICFNIIIICRGSVVEAGTVDEVIRAPKHPYTQLLIDSIPRMTAVRNWEMTKEEATDTPGDKRKSLGCKLASRCPVVMEKCWSQVPDLYRTGENQIARCFLYEDRSVFTETDIAKTFARPQPIPQPSQASTTPVL